MGESIAEGTITKWLVKVGETVERDQPLFEISTDKVDAEIPSPEDGVLLEVRHGEGETVPVDEIVAMLGAEGEELTSGPVIATVTKRVEEVEVASVTEVPAPSPQPLAAAPVDAPEQPVPIAPDDPDAALKERIRTHSSPLVRNMAAAAGVEISQLSGSGIHGRVTKADLERFLADGGQGAVAVPATSPTVSPPAAPAAPQQGVSVPPARPSTPAVRQPGDFHVAAYAAHENVEIEPMSKIRQITAAHMSYSKATSAHVTTCFDIDLSRVAKIRNQAKDNFLAAQGTKLSFMPFIFRAVANALKTNRKLNASLDGTNVVFKKDINLGMAVALDWGLLVPVIKNADQLSLVGLAKAANDLAAGILGVGVIEKRPIVATDAESNDVISIKTMSYFAITYDHRLVDGADADAFMNDLKHTLATETWNELDPYL
jgi:2-oxoglutarate dehydrogenase E2 component (dihydrolipoamide succinyltransferase)